MKLVVKPLLFDTYLAVIKNSPGANLFRNSYAKVNGMKRDILKNGELSCAFFTSSVLVIFKLIKEIHSTVEGTIRDLEASGWKKIKKPKIGSVLIWEESVGHKHSGFYIGGGKAVSNSLQKRTPIVHHWTFGIKKGKPVRKIIAIYWHKKLDSR